MRHVRITWLAPPSVRMGLPAVWAAASAVLALAGVCAGTASADPQEPAVSPVQIFAPAADAADPAAESACSHFAVILQSTAFYYDNFAEALETYAQTEYAHLVRDSNTLGRTALRQGAAEALSSANTPGLAPDIANPMRSWSLDATKLLLKMGLRGGGETLNVTAAEMNNDAYAVQQACAAAGTHA